MIDPLSGLGGQRLNLLLNLLKVPTLPSGVAPLTGSPVSYTHLTLPTILRV